jgi:BASS family bile acid:Na+ symporter
MSASAAASGFLARAGRSGPTLLCGGVLIGLIAPLLAEVARPLMGVAVFVFTLGAFLKVDGDAFRAEAADRRAMLAILAWATFGVPLLAFALVQVARPGPDTAVGLLLCTLAPPVGSAAAIAAMLGLSAPLALLATVAATLAAPFYLPPLAAVLAGAELAVDPLALAARLGLIVGGAAGASWLLRRFAGRWVAANPNAMTGIAVLGLLLVAVGAMDGMRDQILAAPGRAGLLLGLAFLANAGLQAAGALLFGAMDRTRALTVGLVSGNRNVTLVWAAAAPFLADRPGVELFLAMAVFPIFMLPAVTRRLLPALQRGAPPVPMAFLPARARPPG